MKPHEYFQKRDEMELEAIEQEYWYSFEGETGTCDVYRDAHHYKPLPRDIEFVNTLCEIGEK